MTYRTEAELRAAADGGRLVETESLDLKWDLPPAGDKGSRAIATDLAAFALGGGKVIVGVDEGPPVTLSPIPLAGQRERVEQIARHRVDPPVACTVTEVPSEAAGAGHGYLVITIPASAERPHAVDEAFYGRFGTTNSRLSAAEVRRLMQGTPETGPTIEELLDAWVAADPTPDDQRRQAHLFLVARPTDASAEMLQDALGTEWDVWSRQTLVDGRQHLEPGWSPDMGGLWRWDRVPDGWRGTTDQGPWQTFTEKRETHWLDVELGEDGTIRVFSGRGSDHRGQENARVIIELIIGGTVRRGVEAAVAEATGYQGRWDIAVAITNLRGVVSYFRHDNWWVEAGDLPPYRDDTYRRSWSGTTSELRQDLDAVVDRLVGSLNRTLNEGRVTLPRPPAPPAPDPEAD